MNEEMDCYRALWSAVLYQAIDDARKAPGMEKQASKDWHVENNAADALDFLFSDRSLRYLEALEIDPIGFREGLIREHRGRCHDYNMTSHMRDAENRKRINFMRNYMQFLERA